MKLISWSQYFTAQFRQTSFLIYFTLFSVVKQPNLGLHHLTVEVPRSHTIRRACAVGLLQTSDQYITDAYSTHKKHKRQTSVPSAGFEPTIPAIMQLQTYTLDCTTTRIIPYIFKTPFSLTRVLTYRCVVLYNTYTIY